jgi:acrylyl-CoA reductase (NADPH)
MTADTFTALVLDQAEDGVKAAIKALPASALPAGDVTVAISWSDLNYKDGMVLKGLGKLVRTYPHVPGVDFAGTVVSSDAADYKPGDKVVLTGWRVGEAHWGGYATLARVKADWLVKLPDGLSEKQAMACGTAGLSAMLAVMALEDHGLKPGDGEVLVTGAAGGVGSVAVAVLAALGHRVAASTGRAETHDYLKELGAAVIVDRAELEAPTKGPLASERWAGAIDNVAGPTLAHVLAELRYKASCAAVGLAAGFKLDTTVVPFLLRGVNLLGIDSVHAAKPRRIEAWRRLARDLPKQKLDAITQVATLKDLPALADRILKGQVRGRTVIDVNG